MGVKKKLFIKNYLDFNWVRDKKNQKLILSYILILNKGFVS